MTDGPDTEQMLARFRQWLGEVRVDAEAFESDVDSGDGEGGGEAVGLWELVRAFTALRHDVKLQAKSARNLESETAAAVEALQEATRQLRAIEPKEAEAAQRAATPLVEALADLDEALQRGQTALEAARERIVQEAGPQFQRRLEELYAGQSAWRRWLGRRWHQAVGELARQAAENQRQVLDSLGEGYVLVRSRLQRAMAREGLERIVCLGQPVDPHTMTVVQTVDDPLRTPGTVVDEVRPGYLWKGRVLRFAEVQAVRQRRAPRELSEGVNLADGDENEAI